MKALEAVRAIMELTGVKPSVLANRLGIKNNTMSNRLSREDITMDKYNETLRALDYKIIVVPSNTRVPDGGFEVR